MRPACRLAVALALPGCAAPISNAAFYEDAAFLAAVPSAADLAVPEPFLRAPADRFDVIAGGQAAAARYTLTLAPIAAAGDTLRAVPPDERTDVLRAWSATTVAFSGEDGPALGWIDASVVRTDDTAWVDLRAAAEADGTYAPLADGVLLADGVGHMDVDLAVVADAFGTAAAPGALAIDWKATDDPAARELTVVRSEGFGPAEGWAVQGPAFGWSGEFRLTDDGLAWPGWAVAVHLEAGGRVQGEVHRDGGPLLFEACWDPDGSPTWVGGDAGIAETGDAALCALDLP